MSCSCAGARPLGDVPQTIAGEAALPRWGGDGNGRVWVLRSSRCPSRPKAKAIYLAHVCIQPKLRTGRRAEATRVYCPARSVDKRPRVRCTGSGELCHPSKRGGLEKAHNLPICYLQIANRLLPPRWQHGIAQGQRHTTPRTQHQRTHPRGDRSRTGAAGFLQTCSPGRQT